MKSYILFTGKSKKCNLIKYNLNQILKESITESHLLSQNMTMVIIESFNSLLLKIQEFNHILIFFYLLDNYD